MILHKIAKHFSALTALAEKERSAAPRSRKPAGVSLWRRG